MKCVNCGIAIQRLQRHLVSSLSARHQSRLSCWLSDAQTQLPLDALICQPCFLLLDTEAGEHERLLGHTMVCVGCGKSVRRIKQYHNVNMECPLLAVLISQNTYYVPSRNNYVCHMCWIRANRLAVVDSTCDMQELASDNMQDLASNNNAAAPPDVQEDRVNAILVNVYRYFATEGTDLSPSQLRERTALCTGASEADVECALVLHQDSHVVSATQKPLRKPPRKRRKKESKSPVPIQEEEPYIERETLIVTVDPKAGDANSEINPLAIKEEQPSSPITCEQDASFCEPQQSGLKPEETATVFVKTEPKEEPNTGPSQSSRPEQSSGGGPTPDIPPDTYFVIKNEEIDIEDNCGSDLESEEGYS